MSSSASIDFSPNPSVKNITLILEDSELKDAEFSRFERFLRVWFTDSKLYAPHLTDLTIVLRPSADHTHAIYREGVNKFMEHYYNLVAYRMLNDSPLRYSIVLDNYATINDNCVLEYADEQKVLERRPSLLCRTKPHAT